MEGQWIRLNRLFSEGGRAVIIALDAGAFSGSPGKLGILPEAVDDFCDADALVVSPGMMRHCGHAFDYRGAPLAAVRLNWPAARASAGEYRGGRTSLLATPAASQAVGADLAVADLYLPGHDASEDAEAVAAFSDLVRRKRECGLPLIGQCLPPNAGGMPPGHLADTVRDGARRLAELGADAVITHFVADEMIRVVETCPVPVLACHPQAAADGADQLAMASRAVAAGARGVCVSGAALDTPDAAEFIRALCRVVKDEADPDDVAGEFEPT